MSCRSCDLCLKDPRANEYTPRCFSCEARAVAAIGAHIESQALKVMTPHYRGVLEKIFGDRWKEGGAEVKNWGARIDASTKHKKVNP